MIDRIGRFPSGSPRFRIFSLSTKALLGFSLRLCKIAFRMVFDNSVLIAIRGIQPDLPKSPTQASDL